MYGTQGRGGSGGPGGLGVTLWMHGHSRLVAYGGIIGGSSAEGHEVYGFVVHFLAAGSYLVALFLHGFVQWHFARLPRPAYLS